MIAKKTPDLSSFKSLKDLAVDANAKTNARCKENEGTGAKGHVVCGREVWHKTKYPKSMAKTKAESQG